MLGAGRLEVSGAADVVGLSCVALAEALTIDDGVVDGDGGVVAEADGVVVALTVTVVVAVARASVAVAEG